MRNFVAYSHDGGRAYTPPEFLDLPRGGIEFSGPALALPDGRLLAFGPPFSVSAKGQITTQFYNLKFGQPSLTRLADGTSLLVFWRKSPAGRYEIVIRKYR